MRKLNRFFYARPKLIRTLLWSLWVIAMVYGLLIALAGVPLPLWGLYVVLIPCFYFFWLDKKAGYDPRKDRFSKEYVPYKHRKKK